MKIEICKCDICGKEIKDEDKYGYIVLIERDGSLPNGNDVSRNYDLEDLCDICINDLFAFVETLKERV